MQLRHYQIELLDGARAAYRKGYKHPCIVAPCGAGKSVIVAEMARLATEKGNRVLFLVHRQELCAQIYATFCECGVNVMLCDIMMVQTATRRLDRLPRYSLIITDENHHCLAASYRRIYDHYKDVPTVGVTATPCRLNGGGLGDVNDVLVEGVTTRWLIDNKYLAPYEYYAPTLASVTGVKTTHGEYDAKAIADVMSKPAIYGDTVKYYRELAAGRQAICYCASVKASKETAMRFVADGIPAEHIDGETPTEVRRAAIDAFRRGETKVLCNVDLISEGFDVPDCSVSILLRPTKSLTLYIQQAMRCMRYKPDKTAIIIDHVGNYTRHGLPDEEREWTLAPKKAKPRGENELTTKQCPDCYAVVEGKTRVCPSCGYVWEVASREVEEVPEAQLQRIITTNYTTPADCKDMASLYRYAKQHGYKSGWAYYQGKMRGWC